MNLYLDLKTLEIDEELSKGMECLTELLRERTRAAIKENFDKENAPCSMFEYTVRVGDWDGYNKINLTGYTTFGGEFIDFNVQYGDNAEEDE